MAARDSLKENQPDQLSLVVWYELVPVTFSFLGLGIPKRSSIYVNTTLICSQATLSPHWCSAGEKTFLHLTSISREYLFARATKSSFKKGRCHSQLGLFPGVVVAIQFLTTWWHCSLALLSCTSILKWNFHLQSNLLWWIHPILYSQW